MLRHIIFALGGLGGLLWTDGFAQEIRPETVRFTRPTAKGFVLESTVTLQTEKNGWNIVSVTRPGNASLTLSARYDAQDRLLAAEVSVRQENDKAIQAVVEVTGGKATIQRAGQAKQEFAIPAGVIVTSAPDWTDIYLLCRRYDFKKGGKQAFTGLWVHPTQAAMVLPFTIEKTGTDKMTLADKEEELTRFTIRIRGPHPYLAWADAHGNLVRLIPQPVKDNTPTGLVREGYEKVKLSPPPAVK